MNDTNKSDCYKRSTGLTAQLTFDNNTILVGLSSEIIPGLKSVARINDTIENSMTYENKTLSFQEEFYDCLPQYKALENIVAGESPQSRAVSEILNILIHTDPNNTVDSDGVAHTSIDIADVERINKALFLNSDGYDTNDDSAHNIMKTLQSYKELGIIGNPYAAEIIVVVCGIRRRRNLSKYIERNKKNDNFMGVLSHAVVSILRNGSDFNPGADSISKFLSVQFSKSRIMWAFDLLRGSLIYNGHLNHGDSLCSLNNVDAMVDSIVIRDAVTMKHTKIGRKHKVAKTIIDNFSSVAQIATAGYILPEGKNVSNGDIYRSVMFLSQNTDVKWGLDDASAMDDEALEKYLHDVVYALTENWELVDVKTYINDVKRINFAMSFALFAPTEIKELFYSDKDKFFNLVSDARNIWYVNYDTMFFSATHYRKIMFLSSYFYKKTSDMNEVVHLLMKVNNMFEDVENVIQVIEAGDDFFTFDEATLMAILGIQPVSRSGNDAPVGSIVCTSRANKNDDLCDKMLKHGNIEITSEKEIPGCILTREEDDTVFSFFSTSISYGNVIPDYVESYRHCVFVGKNGIYNYPSKKTISVFTNLKEYYSEKIGCVVNIHTGKNVVTAP